MNDRDGQAAFGFAPRHRLIEKQAADRPKTTLAKPVSPAVATAVIEASAPANPNWVWLLIGVFLGAGGTMVASSFWLQDGHVIRPVIDGDPVAAAVAADRTSVTAESIPRSVVSPLAEMAAFAAAHQSAVDAGDGAKEHLDGRPSASTSTPGPEIGTTPIDGPWRLTAPP